MISSIFLVEDSLRASCLICKTENNNVIDLYHESKLECPISGLHYVKSSMHSRVRRIARETIAKNAINVADSARLNTSNITYHLMLRKVRLSYFICQNIRKLLSSKQLIKSFETVASDYDINIFGLNVQNKFEVKFLLEDGFALLDDLFHPMWDVHHDSSDPTSKYSFVRALTIKLQQCRLIITIQRSISIDPYCEAYRNLALRAILSQPDPRTCAIDSLTTPLANSIDPPHNDSS